MSAIILFLIFIPILTFILLSVNLVLAPHMPYKEKKTPFECGYHSFLWQNRTQFTVLFFVFGLLFILFDLEIILIFPFGVTGYLNAIYGLVVVIIFALIVTVGFVFELGKNALSIESKQTIKLTSSIVYLLEKCISVPIIINRRGMFSILNMTFSLKDVIGLAALDYIKGFTIAKYFYMIGITLLMRATLIIAYLCALGLLGSISVESVGLSRYLGYIIWTVIIFVAVYNANSKAKQNPIKYTGDLVYNPIMGKRPNKRSLHNLGQGYVGSFVYYMTMKTLNILIIISTCYFIIKVFPLVIPGPILIGMTPEFNLSSESELTEDSDDLSGNLIKLVPINPTGPNFTPGGPDPAPGGPDPTPGGPGSDPTFPGYDPSGNRDDSTGGERLFFNTPTDCYRPHTPTQDELNRVTTLDESEDNCKEYKEALPYAPAHIAAFCKTDLQPEGSEGSYIREISERAVDSQTAGEFRNYMTNSQILAHNTVEANKQALLETSSDPTRVEREAECAKIFVQRTLGNAAQIACNDNEAGTVQPNVARAFPGTASDDF